MPTTTTLTPVTALDLSSIKNAALLKECKALSDLQSSAASAYASTVTEFEAIRRKQAAILDRIQSTKLYEKDGFKSLAEFATTIGLNKSNAHQLAAAGRVYNDKSAPEALKALSPSKLGVLASAIKADKERVYADAETQDFASATQEQLKAYAADRAAKTSPKAKVVPEYYADVNGKPCIVEGRTHYIMDDWEAYFMSNGDEYIKLPNGKLDPESNKANMKRAVAIHGGTADYITYRQCKPNSDAPVDTSRASIDKEVKLGIIRYKISEGFPLTESEQSLADEYGIE